MTLPVLIDLDCIMVDMLPAWMDKYNKATGDGIKVADIKEYDLRSVCDPIVLDKILCSPGFFYDMEPLPGAVEHFSSLYSDGYDLAMVTQPPRKSEYAVRDKIRWVKKHIPEYDLSNMFFCHRKNLVRGAVLFDDKPEHLISWKENNTKGLTATIDWLYNRHVNTDFRGSFDKGWEFFGKFIRNNVKRSR